ncbi:MAG: phosphoenolpyruvate--protein phosphotransferase [Acidobacteriota bacterium]
MKIRKKKLKGKPVSPGIVTGKALIFNSQKKIILKEKIERSQIKDEIERFTNAVKITGIQLKKIYKNLQKAMGNDSALIIESQYLLLKENRLIDEIKEKITKECVKTEWAIKEVTKKYYEFFNNITDLSFREKGNDISDILDRITENLEISSKEKGDSIENVILVADDISPSIAANLMSRGKLLGIVLNRGGETSHTVILARTLEIPTILDTGNATEEISNEDTLIVDGLNGEIIINPDEAVQAKTRVKIEKYKIHKERLKEIIKLPDETKDGHNFKLMANIELPFESDIVQSYGARGIGLYRTEFLFMDPSIVLSEKEQFLIYKNIAQKVYPNEVTIRTFDVGRDKGSRYFKTSNEVNPALGTMAVRLFLKEKKIFLTQIKAILRANESGNIKMLFPMITEIEEIFAIKNIINQAKKELKDKGHLPEFNIKIGIMVEIPGTIKLIKHLKDEIDFFSIGTNDLIQYLLAVERNNSSLSYLFNPFQPSVIESLIEIREEISKTGKEVTVCGEIAGKTFTALMLLGMGYTNFSMNPLSIIEIKRIFTEIHYSHIRKTVKRLPEFSSRSESEEFLIESILKKYPQLFVKQPIF